MNASSHVPDDEVSLDIAAPPEKVWALVADIRNMGRWSPETFRTRWLRGSNRPVRGARFKGYNRWGHIIVWGTVAEIDAAEPGREFTFTTVVWGKRRTQWSYRFTSSDGGTHVTESRTAFSNTWFRRWFQDTFMHGHAVSYPQAMLTTLQRIKAAAERSA